MVGDAFFAGYGNIGRPRQDRVFTGPRRSGHLVAIGPCRASRHVRERVRRSTRPVCCAAGGPSGSHAGRSQKTSRESKWLKMGVR
jgi:hypothetical protein